MDQLTKFLVKELVDGKSVTAIYGGGFKPPTKGHFDLVKATLKDFPEIDKFIIYVGGGVRDGIGQEQSLEIWGLYKEILGKKIEIIPSSAPIGDILRYAKTHPDDEVYFVIGYREGRQDDIEDISSRTKGVEEKYPNIKIKVITTTNGDMSGTNARKSIGDKEKFFTYLPDEVPPGEKEEVYNIVSKSLLKEHSMGNSIDLKSQIDRLTQHMIDKGYNIEPLPALEFIDDDITNAEKFLGKTAYYDPINKSITLYTHGRHPKDIARSYAHEMIHHIQNLEGRLGNITTTNTQEDDKLNDLEAEANLKGTMTFRNWTDGLDENTTTSSYPFKVTDKTYDDEDNSLITVSYELTTPDNSYRVEFYSGEYSAEAKTFDLSFGVNTGDLNTIDTFQMTGEGNARKIFKTILNIVEDFINKEDVEKIVVDGTDEKRKRIYKAIFSSTPPNISDKIELKEAKNKDPFGLNQYARELAQGLEEEIVGKKIECDGCGWGWNIKDGGDDLYICHKCGHDNSPQLNEGRYDRFTNELSSLAFELIKDGHSVGRKILDEIFIVGPEDEDPDIISNDFEFDFRIIAKYTNDVYTVDGGANAGYDDEGDEIQPLLSVKFKIPKNPDWQTVSFDLKDVIRHELEHLTQDGGNLKGGTDSDDPRLVRPSKYMADDKLFRDMIDADLLPKATYFKLEKEVDAMLQGLYLKAKKSKKPFLSTIDDYLDKQPISQDERKEILNLWAKRAKALSLPSFTSAPVKETSYLYDTGVDKKGDEMRERGGRKPVIFCDMDGVLVNFDKGYQDLTGMSTHHVDAQGKKEFWKAFRQGLENSGESEKHYWANLDWQPGGKELWDYIKEYNPYILTAPSVNFDLPYDQRYNREYNESMQGKLEWVQRLSNMRKIYFASAVNKPKFAGSNKILIDDRKDTIDSWNANGGIGILHTSAENTIKQLKELGL
jgi:hypothetical protein